jgi:hypothetical protein
MPRVQIHCYGCDATVPVATTRSSEDLSRAGWSLHKGETYCPKCAPERVPPGAVSAAEGEEVAASPEPVGAAHGTGSITLGADRAAAAAAATSPEHPSPESPHAVRRFAKRWIPAGDAASVLTRIKWPRFGRTTGAEPRLGPLKPVAAVVITTLQVPFRKPHTPVTSHSSVTPQTIALFCIAVVLTLATLGSNDLIVRLPGVACSLAAGLSWLHDLRSRS